MVLKKAVQLYANGNYFNEKFRIYFEDESNDK